MVIAFSARFSELLIFRQGLSEKDVLDLNAGWRETTANAMRAVAKAGGWVWQMFSGRRASAFSGTLC